MVLCPQRLNGYSRQHTEHEVSVKMVYTGCFSKRIKRQINPTNEKRWCDCESEIVLTQKWDTGQGNFVKETLTLTGSNEPSPWTTGDRLWLPFSGKMADMMQLLFKTRAVESARNWI
jgi:hypothetical protein